jgi:xylulokinase
MALVAGVDSSTQSVKVVIRDASTGKLIREGRASHPDGTEVDPAHWWEALQKAIAQAGGLDDVAAISIGGQQHGMVALDASGEVIRPALLWNDTRSAREASDINSEIPDIAALTGSALVASFTASKVRWLADNEKSNADRIAAVCLPHDWLSWKLSGSKNIDDIFTDRSDASGTGYFNSVTSKYLPEVFEKMIRSNQTVYLPRIVSSQEFGATTSSGLKIGAGAGDNAAAGFGAQAHDGDVIVSLGTSGTAFALSKTPTHDSTGTIAGFASLSGDYLPLVCTLNAARILDAAARILGVSHEELGELALKAPAGAHGLSLLPYFEGERTPNRPDATGLLSGITIANSNREDIARAYIEGMLCGLADAVDALENAGVEIKRVFLVGGAAKNPAVAHIASSLFGREVLVPPPGEYVANGAARQAAWALSGEAQPPKWNLGDVASVKGAPAPEVLFAYRKIRDFTENLKTGS